MKLEKRTPRQLVAELAKALSMPALPKTYARTPDEIRVDRILRQM